LKAQASIKNADIFKYDVVWQTSFFTDDSFLKLYSTADNKSKADLQDTTINAYGKGLKNDLLAWKYKSTNFSKPTLLDTFTLLYTTICFDEHKNNNETFELFIQGIVKDFAEIYQIDIEKVLKFIFKHYDMFKIIFENFISLDDDFTERFVAPYKTREIKTIILTEKIDTTSKDGIEKLEIVREVLKKLAKEKSQYKCALADIKGCRYFTSKDDNKNYLEIHHLVPREFAYEFDDTIEFVENYIPLCPHCHRMLHKAVDRERKDLIYYLFNQRIGELKKHNINIDIKGLYEFYKIDE
jgi:hypothetical protein